MFDKYAKILVVDDIKTMRKIIINALRQIDLTNVIEADDGESAWMLLEEAINIKEKIDLIICDWNMPKMNGLELLSKVRSSDVYKDLPFLMVTAKGEKDNICLAVQNKVSDYIVKPFTADLLKVKINNAYLKHLK